MQNKKDSRISLLSILPDFLVNWHFLSHFVWKSTKTLKLLRIFDDIFDVINGEPFLTLYKTSAIELFHFMIRKEPRKLVNKTYKAVVFQPAIDFLQQLSVSAFVRHPDFKKVLCRCCYNLFIRHGLRTPNEAFFHPKLLGLGR